MRTLIKARARLQEFDTSQDTTKLILPTTTRGEHLFEDQRATSDLVFIPSQTTEVAHGSQDGRGKDAAGAQSATSRNGGEQGEFDARAKGIEFLFELLAPKACKHKGCLRDGER